MNWLEERERMLKDLVGATVTMIEEEYDGEQEFGFTLPAIELVSKSGRKYHIDILQDPEGNGPGHLDMICFALVCTKCGAEAYWGADGRPYHLRDSNFNDPVRDADHTALIPKE